MTSLFKKLNFRGHTPIWVVKAPESFHLEIETMKQFTEIKTDEPTLSDKASFVLFFAEMKTQLDQLSEAIAPVLDKNAILWVAYPKQSSTKYASDFNRDKGWDVLMEYGYKGVRQISIDEDWSALRFSKK